MKVERRPNRADSPSGPGGTVHRVRVLSRRKQFWAGPDEDLLTAALRQGVDIMYGCRHGNCGTCKHFLREGEVREGQISPYAITSDERDNGAILLCSTYARSDVSVEPPDTYPEAGDGDITPPEPRKAEVTAVWALSGGLTEMRVRLNQPLLFRAGQYVELWIPGTEERRSFSMANPPSRSGELTFVIPGSPRGLFRQQGWAPRAGDVLRLQGPFGHFRFHDTGRPVVMIALGSGIAPLLSILADGAERSMPGGIILFFGGTYGEEPFAGELHRLSASLADLKVVRAPAGRSGVTELEHLTGVVAREIRDASLFDGYLSGHPSMCDALTTLLTAKGLPEHRIRCERFYPAIP